MPPGDKESFSLGTTSALGAPPIMNAGLRVSLRKSFILNRCRAIFLSERDYQKVA